MAPGWQVRWMRSWFVWLLGMGLMATPAVADLPSSLDELASKAYAEKDPKHRDALLLEGYLEASNLDARACLGGDASLCESAIARRLMLHWTRHELAAPSPPASASKPGKVLGCSAGEVIDGCLERSLGSGTLGIWDGLRPGRYFFIYALPQPPRAVRFVIGEVSAANGVERMGQEAYSIELLADDSREDPLLLEVLSTHGKRPVIFGPGQVLEAERYVQRVEKSKTFVTNRRLHKGFFAICGNEVQKIEKPKLLRVSVGLGEFARMLYPEYHYALPCKASVVLDESIQGIRTGKYEPGRVCLVQKKGQAGTATQPVGDVPFTVQEDPAAGDCRVELRSVRRGSALVFSGDLNGDGLRDFVYFHVGEMGCGGPSLYLSSPQGWFQAGFSHHYC